MLLLKKNINLVVGPVTPLVCQGILHFLTVDYFSYHIMPPSVFGETA